ncbi:RNA-directed DNA polymerase from mobile element jockey [Smittium culicis]|uniref:RNA-directed DNA polymerase from mobile element jockey n=1 Tax=Smittium culicis TaxID=133412 RepID=A0A1R1YEL8_9FUNG|nr:RNA-directed DNA polymerase from mobile element jockey [Smittium culicis]
MYYDPKIAVRIDDGISELSEYHRRVQQGCSASPILFDLYINDIFSDVLGVDVSGLPNRIPGLPFADDAVVLADSAENLQTSLDAISAWSDAWEMAVSASKCAIMAINCDDAVEMTLQRQTIRTTDNYTYLGYIMNSKWGVSDTIRNNKIKA